MPPCGFVSKIVRQPNSRPPSIYGRWEGVLRNIPSERPRRSEQTVPDANHGASSASTAITKANHSSGDSKRGLSGAIAAKEGATVLLE